MAMTTNEPVVVAPPIPNQGGYWAFMCPAKVHNELDATLADVERDSIPEAALARMADGIAAEAVRSTQFASQLGAAPLADDVVAAADDPEVEFATLVDKVTDLLISAGVGTVWVPECDRSIPSKRRREVITRAALAAYAATDGACGWFIWNARLVAVNGRISEPDFIVHNLPGDVKDAKTLEGKAAPQPLLVSSMTAPALADATEMVVGDGRPKVKHSLQLAHYYRHMQELGVLPRSGKAYGVILGREDQLVWRDLSAENTDYLDATTGTKRKMSALEIYDQKWAYRREVAAAALDVNAEPLVSPARCADCPSCEWRTYCHDTMVELDELTLVQGISPAQAAKHHKAGVFTRYDLARLHHPTAVAIDAGVPVASLLAAAPAAAPDDPADVLLDAKAPRAHYTALTTAGLAKVSDVTKLDPITATAYAGVKITSLARDIDAARVTKRQKVHLARGVSELNVPRFDVELDVDMENDPGGIIYLWGTRLTVNKRSLPLPDGEYRWFGTFEPDDHTGEAQAFADLWSYMGGLALVCHLAGLTFGAWCYTSAEQRCMRHLADKHVGFPGVPTIDQVDAFMASDQWVDLYRVLLAQTLWPTEDMTLKTTAKWARHSWRDSDPGGDASTLWYRVASSDPDPAARSASRTRILEYNEDDVLATHVLRKWLRRLASARKADNRMPKVSELNRKFPRGRTRSVRPA